MQITLNALLLIACVPLALAAPVAAPKAEALRVPARPGYPVAVAHPPVK